MKIVQFKDGTYGIRRLTFSGFEYLDFNQPEYWWDIKSRPFCDCKTSKEEVLKAYERFGDKGTIVSYESLKAEKE